MEAEFWQTMEKLVVSTSIVIARPRGSSHPHFPDITFPIDYGYLEGTKSTDGSGIDAWIGSDPKMDINGFLATVDLQKMDSEIKLVLGCSDDEILIIQNFHNSNGMRAIFIQNKEK